MKKMIYFEIKKVFSGFGGKIAAALLVLMLAVTSWLAIIQVEFVDENGEHHSGIKASRQLMETKNQWAGWVDTQLLQKVLRENDRVIHTPEYLSKNVTDQEKAYAMRQGFSDIREMINKGFMPFRDYDYYRADSVSLEEVGNLYENRIQSLKDWLDTEGDSMYTAKEKEFFLTRFRELETPFYYEYHEGWKTAAEYADTIIMLGMLILSFLVSGIFSREFTLKSDAIFFSSRWGREKGVYSKLFAGLIIITAVYWSVMLLYSVIVLGVLGTGGGDCVIQISLWKSFYHLTFKQCYLLTLFGGYLGNLVILGAAMLVSSKTRSTVLAVTIPFLIIWIDPFFGGASFKALGLMPDQLLMMRQAVNYFYVYEIGDKIVGAVPILLCMYTVILAVICPLIVFVYKRTQVK